MPSIRDILGPSGPIATELGGGYEPRQEQVAMAEAVARAMAAKSHLVVEAGTGVGKSFAYLVPAILRCVLNNERVIVSTHTINLQEQLVTRDIPLLRGALERAGIIPPPPPPESGARGGLVPVLVKGRGNYVSIRRLKLASDRADRILADAPSRRSLKVIAEWAMDTLDGSLATLPPLERPGVWDRVQSDSGNCMGRKCRNYNECFYQNARRAMEKGNLLVCNHALFFSDLALRAEEVGFLPDYSHVVLDEAHNVEDVASDHFGISLAEGRVAHLLSTLYQGRAGKGYLVQLAMAGGDAVEGAIRRVAAAEDASRAFFDSLLGLEEVRKSGQGGRIRRADAIENALTPAMNDLALALRALKDAAKDDQDRFELNAYMERAAAIAADAQALVAQSRAGCAYWVEVSRSDRGPRVTLACAPIDLAPVLKQHLFSGEFGVTLTSATLATGPTGTRSATHPVASPQPAKELGDGRRFVPDEASEKPEGPARTNGPADKGGSPFAHFLSRIGAEGSETLLLGSPFEYARQVEVFVEKSMPRPDDGKERAANPTNGDAAYSAILAEKILEHVDATDGGAFVLFTSFRALEAAARSLAGPLARRGMPLLSQTRDGSRAALLETFRKDRRSVLLGAASFWQGVDVRGEGLRNVIITRLPFEPPDRPLTEARMEAIQARGGDPFREDSLPRAILRFKQGFGRLVRSKTDRGRVVILDPRVATTGYGRAFLGALPDGMRVVTR